MLDRFRSYRTEVRNVLTVLASPRLSTQLPKIHTRTGVLPAVLIIAFCLPAAVALIIARIGGVNSYVTDPLSITALTGSAAGIILLAHRSSVLSDKAGTRWFTVLAASVAAYLIFSGIAVTSSLWDVPFAKIATGIWTAWWAAPLVIIQLIALRTYRVFRWWAWGFAALSVLSIVTAVFRPQTDTPFAAHSTAVATAPADSPIADTLGTLALSATLVTPILLALHALRASGQERTDRILATCAAALPPLLIIICMGLAVARDPGNVNPSIGSVAYLVSLSLGCLLAAAVLSFTGHKPANLPVLRRLLAGIIGGYALVGAMLAATWIVAALSTLGALATGAIVTGLGAVTLFLWWRAVTALFTFLDTDTDTEKPVSTEISLLSARENEVLALIAEGLRDADIAEKLQLSKRTVETHVRRIFQKLDLDVDDGRNRRLLAARVWLQAETSPETPNSLIKQVKGKP